MKFRKKKEEENPVRQPHFDPRKQAAYHYSSSRSQSERSTRGVKEEKTKAPLAIRILKDTIFVTVVLGTIALAFILSIITAAPKVITQADEAPLRDSYQASANEISSSGITSRSKITLNRNKISNELQAKYPEIVSADISTPVFGRSPVISLRLSKPSVLLISNDKQYIVDNRGIAVFERGANDSIINENDLVKVEDPSSAPIALSKHALTSSQVSYLAELKHQAESKKLTIDYVNLDAGGGEFVVKFNELNYQVKFSSYEEARKSFGTFIAAREQAEKNRLKPSEYIDVRVPERAYIK